MCTLGGGSSSENRPIRPTSKGETREKITSFPCCRSLAKGGPRQCVPITPLVRSFACGGSLPVSAPTAGWYWLASITLVLSVLFVPKVTVGIVDKTGAGAVTVVDNVPFGLAALGSLTSRVGNTLTELYETAMQVLPGSAALPADLAYQRNGLLFGKPQGKELSLNGSTKSGRPYLMQRT